MNTADIKVSGEYADVRDGPRATVTVDLEDLQQLLQFVQCAEPVFVSIDPKSALVNAIDRLGDAVCKENYHHDKGRDCLRTDEVLNNYRKRAFVAETALARIKRWREEESS